MHGVEPSAELEIMKLDDGAQAGAFPNFTVEMETGTGKTYVYLRTMRELAKTYGFRKFVIVVPSVAIREGVLSSLKITKEHFQTLYDYERTGIPTKLGRTPGSVRRKPPQFAADGNAILKEAGYSEAEIDGLVKDGVVFTERRRLR